MIDYENSGKVNARILSNSSLAETTAQYILDAICDEKIKSNDPFPSQYQLSEWFGVSRTTIREATQILVSKGIIDVKHGKRITIRPPSHLQIAESVSLTFRRSGVSVLDVLELRKVLEVEAAGLAACRATEDDMRQMNEWLVVMEAKLDIEEGYVEADVAFHQSIFTAARQPAFELVLGSLNDYLLESRKASYRGSNPTKRALEAHHEILTAIEQKDEQAARSAMRMHLEETERNIMGI